MEYLIEIELSCKGEPIYSTEFYADEMSTLGHIISEAQNVRDYDSLVVYLSKRDELIKLWELPTDEESFPTKLAGIMEEISKKVKKGGTNEDKRTYGNSGDSYRAVRQSAT